MRVIKRDFRALVLVAIVAGSLSGSFALMSSTSTYAKSIPEDVADFLTGRKNSGSNDKNQASPAKSTAPAPTQTPAATATKQTTTAVATAKPSTVSEPIKSTAATIAKPADTSIQVRQVAAAQAVRSYSPSQYSSSKISGTERNDLYKASVAAASIGAIIYLLSYAKPWQWFYKNTVSTSKIATQ